MFHPMGSPLKNLHLGKTEGRPLFYCQNHILNLYSGVLFFFRLSCSPKKENATYIIMTSYCYYKNEYGERAKLETGTKQRIGNDVTNRARVQVKFCSHTVFHFSVPLPVPRFPFLVLLTTSSFAVSRFQDSSTLGTFSFLTQKCHQNCLLFRGTAGIVFAAVTRSHSSFFTLWMTSASLLSHETSVYRRRRRVAEEGRKDTRQLNVFHARLAVVSCVLHRFNSRGTENTRTPSTYNTFRFVLWSNGDTDPSKS